LLADPAAQQGHNLLGEPGLLPPGDVPVHGLPGWEVERQPPPRTAGPHHVQDRVQDVAAVMLLGSSTGAARAAAVRSAPIGHQ
jgi:hypothetical protein